MLGLLEILLSFSRFLNTPLLRDQYRLHTVFYFVKPKRKKMKRINVTSNISKDTNSIKCILILPKLFELPQPRKGFKYPTGTDARRHQEKPH